VRTEAACKRNPHTRGSCIPVNRTDLAVMTLTPEQIKKFDIAASILEENRKATEKFKERTNGITNGDSERTQKAIRKLLGK
jgi:hypothetical protein